MPHTRFAVAALATATLALGPALPAMAQQATEAPGAISLQLNSLRTIEQGCRVAFVLQNATGQDIEALSYEIAVFDSEGRLDRMLVLPFGALPSAKTRAMQFDLTETECEGISQVLVNTVAECSAAGAAELDCLAALDTSNLTEVEFGQ